MAILLLRFIHISYSIDTYNLFRYAFQRMNRWNRNLNNIQVSEFNSHD